MDLQRRCFSPKMYAKMKELGPVGGHVPGIPPRSANAMGMISRCMIVLNCLDYLRMGNIMFTTNNIEIIKRFILLVM